MFIGADHNLFPIEWAIYAFYALPSTVGSILGRGDSQKNLVEGKKSGLLANKGFETDLRTRSQVLIGVGSSAFALDRLSRNHI